LPLDVMILASVLTMACMMLWHETYLRTILKLESAANKIVFKDICMRQGHNIAD